MLGLEGPSENNHSNVPPTATSPLLNSEEAAAPITPHLTRNQVQVVQSIVGHNGKTSIQVRDYNTQFRHNKQSFSKWFQTADHNKTILNPISATCKTEGKAELVKYTTCCIPDKMQASLLSPSCRRQEMLSDARHLNFVVTVENL